MLIISTDSRSLKKKEALKVTADAVRKIVQLKPDLIYKKIDSVLRGYVLDELKVQMELSGLNKVFIMPANPSLGRTIIARQNILLMVNRSMKQDLLMTLSFRSQVLRLIKY